MGKKQGYSMVIALAVVTVVLAGMGCWFCWHCPSRIYEAHELFWRQLAWNGLGLAAFAVAWLAGWKRLLKSAPCLMGLWLLAFAAAKMGRPINGTYRWICLSGIFPRPFDMLNINVMTCFMPVLSLFVAWLHEKRWIRPWMEWAAILVATVWCVWHVTDNGGWQERIMAFLSEGDKMPDRLYMARQLLTAFDVSKWLGAADRSLGLLPCPESDGMMSASALLFGKWFPLALVGLFATIGALLTLLWQGAGDVSKRRFALLFGFWLIAPVAYCFLHSLAFLPVAGMSPALAGYGGTAVVMAWFGVGVIAAMARGGLPEHSSDIRTESHPDIGALTKWCVVCSWGAMAGVALLLVACATEREFLTPGGRLKFAEPRLSDMAFGEFGLTAKRGRILAADGSPLAYSKRKWRFYLDPCVLDGKHEVDKDGVTEIANGLGVPVKRLLAGYIGTLEGCIETEGVVPYRQMCYAAKDLGISLKEIHDANVGMDATSRQPPRYIFLTEVEDNSSAVEYFNRRHQWLTRRAGIIREPVQKRIYPLGMAATAVVGFMAGGAHADKPKGAGGLESVCDKSLAGVHGVYDKRLPLKERNEMATPKPGADIQTTLVPEIQKAVADALSTACATNGSESAFALVMKVPSGEIAAMASWPSFDPSMRRDLDKWDGSMAVNRPAQVLFEPGGLVKPLTYAIALDSGVLAENATIDQENGAWEYNGVTIRDSETNSLSIAEAIACRANIAAGKTACLIGPEKFHAALRRFGFGSKTGAVGMYGEETGIIAGTPGHWDKTTAMRVGMGYGFATTGLQIAQAYATLANHGALVRPVLVKATETNRAVQVISSASADAIVRMLQTPIPSTVQMCECVPEKGRTVYSQTNHIASCVGFIPSERPEYLVVVSFSKPQPAHTGEEVAIPAFVSIKDALVRLACVLLKI